MHRFRTPLTAIALDNLFLALSLGLWNAIFNNFAVEELAVRADEMGLVQAIREVPGLVGFLVGLLAMVLAEMRIAGISVVVMGVGIFLTAAARDLADLVWATLLMSVGFHFFYSSNASAVLLTAGPDEAPQVLGRLNSLGALAGLISSVFIFATLETWGYRPLFQVAGVVAVVGGLALLPLMRQPARVERPRRRTPLRSRYWLYYALQLLMGSRRHIFTTFAVFLLVREYRLTAQVITMLYLLNNLIGTYLHQAFGGIVVRFGERRVLAFHFVLLTLVFLGYAVVPMLDTGGAPTFQVPGLRLGGWVFCPAFSATPGLLILLGLFVIDNILFGFSIALESYLQKIALAPEEITPNVSLGQTMNHIAAVVVPVVGGLMWEALGAQYTFLAGVVIVLVSWMLTRRM